MPDDINNASADQIEQQNQQSEAEKRIKQLSEKVRLTSEERDEKDNLLKERDEKIASLEKENSFNAGFSEMLSSHPMAKDHKDEIKDKVLSGYSVEDATFAVLGKAGKLGEQEQQAPVVAGGSADTPPAQEKNIADMTAEEKRAVLAEQLVWQ